MTIVLTKDVRVGGSVLASGTTQTLAADIEADLVTRGCATPANRAPGVSDPGANHVADHKDIGGIPQQIACIGTPFVIPPGDGSTTGLQFTGSAGAFTLSAAIMTNVWNLLKGCWCYMPSGFGLSGYDAGWYWAVFSSDTAGVLYADTYVSGRPTSDFSPTAFPVNLAGWLTQTTSEVTGPTGLVLPGGSMGPSGNIKIDSRGSGNVTATKSFRHRLGSTAIFTTSVQAYPSYEFLIVTANQGSESLQSNARVSALSGVGLSSATCSAAESSSVDTSADQTYSISLQNSTNVACSILLHSDVTVTYGA